MAKHKVEMLIYDLDGTLIDSVGDIQTALNEVLLGWEKRPADREATEHWIGGGLSHLLKQALGPESEQDLAAVREEFIRSYEVHLLDTTDLYPGVRKVLEHFRRKRQIVLTNKPERFSKRILDGLNVLSFFDLVLGGDSTPHVKPAVELVHLIQERFPTPADKVVIIGDSPIDMEVGRKAGIRTCAATYGYRTREELEAAHPDFFISQFSQLTELFE